MPEPEDPIKREEYRRHLSESHRGHRHSENTRKKISEALRGKHPVNEFKNGHIVTIETGMKISEAKKGKPTWNRGKKGICSEETIKRMSESQKGNKNHLGKHFSEESKRKISEARLNQIFPTKDTSIEVRLQQELTMRGIRFWKHYPIFGQPDIVIQGHRGMVIFCDGDYWHNRPEVKFRDAKVTERLRNDGWLVLRYWEHEINADVEGVVDEIERLVRR